MINLSMALGYIHYGLKRQSENRQFHMLQGLSFLFMYYDRRKGSVHVEERQEAHYNVARTYHMLGLSHLALPYYARVLEEVEHGRPTPREDLVRDAAYNLQALYATVGNLQLARSIGEQWLEI
jgi:general transcription factor 3C polypeptide 3 (transcription factor C subunit 4)